MTEWERRSVSRHLTSWHCLCPLDAVSLPLQVEESRDSGTETGPISADPFGRIDAHYYVTSSYFAARTSSGVWRKVFVVTMLMRRRMKVGELEIEE